MFDSKNHFSEEDWADFVREVISSEKREMIQQHLNSGCTQCRDSQSFWSTVAQTAGQESEYAVPESALRVAEQAYRIKKIATQPERIAPSARLVFDTWSGVSLAGVRGAGASRYLTYETTDFVVELQVAQSDNRGNCTITGQVATREGTPGSTSGTNAFLIDGNSNLIHHAQADAVGGFQMEFDRILDLTMLLVVPNASVIRIVLPRC
jgi:hypothetical protein